MKLDGDIGSVFWRFVAEGTECLPKFVSIVPMNPVIFKIFSPELGFMLLYLSINVLVKFWKLRVFGVVVSDVFLCCMAERMFCGSSL